MYVALLRGCLLLAIMIAAIWPGPAVCQPPADAIDLAGQPLAAARRTAIDAGTFHRKLSEEKLRAWRNIASRCTMAEFELFLSPLTREEERLIAKMATLSPPIINRLHFEDLRAVLKHGGLRSYWEEERTNSHLKHTTPAVENELYGAYDCVFASVGPPDGSPRYGEVILRLKDTVREHGWATPFSGMHFLSAIRGKDAQQMQQLLADGKQLPTDPTDPLSLGFDDRLHFSHYVVAEQHWEQALAHQAIVVLRGADDSPAGDKIRERFQKLLTENDSHQFWQTFIPPWEPGLPPEEAAARTPFGYLEGKFDDRLSIENFTAIEVPAEQLSEVRSWPEAQPHLALIRAKAKGAP
ncbi:hypothetical protein [Lignipirellula cremea]|uniref:Uncharacterized protein n=1 Tax=Lignipirellula cremea TaxID=2528010 RepID=A0A518DKT3_9BACT|nr:hypothetical protein [Lignipirellula cremea]QDU92430.1 hypothetical protein Pla8534_01780 [Lignipirellula cremea]